MFEEENYLTNYENYGVFKDLILNGHYTLYTKDITNENILEYFTNILNILKDGIETEFVQNLMIDIIFADNEHIQLSIFDLYENLIMWRIIVPQCYIESKHIFFNDRYTRDYIKEYIDRFLIKPYRKLIPIKEMNNIIDNSISLLKSITVFDMYLCNTICNEDFIDLMKSEPRVRELLNCDLSDVPIETVSDVANDLLNELMGYILKSDHCLKDNILSGQGFSKKQFRELVISIASKPNGMGGVFLYTINSSYMNGGLNNLTSLFIDEYIGRLAQILSKENVGDSGDFARLLGLNNQDSFLHHDPNYVCDSKNFQILEIKDKKMLKNLSFRYYRLHPEGMEYMIDADKDTHLIGKTIYLRSPMTCASASEGHGICYRCYGDIAYTNSNINIGKIAAEIQSEQLTQRSLSAKHILESNIRKIIWCDRFDELFTLDGNMISICDTLDRPELYSLVIDKEEIISEGEYDVIEYLFSFLVIDNLGNEIVITTEDSEKIFLNEDLISYIKDHASNNDEQYISINFTELLNMNLFNIMIHNNDLMKALEDIEKTIDNSKLTPVTDRHSLLQRFIEKDIEGGLNVASVHLEIILANQIRDKYDKLEKVDWSEKDPEYQILTLKQALKFNPSITVSLSYRELASQFKNPITFRKRKPSYMDLFFMLSPQEFIKCDNEILPDDNKKDELIEAVRFLY